MLGVALGSSLDPPGSVRELVVSVALEGGVVRHPPSPPARGWYHQLLSVLALEEEPVLGYTAPTPLTRLHLHLCGCALDYRPPPLPLRVLVTAETFSLTSTILTDTDVFLLRLVVDDGALLLSQGEGLDLQTDYVCVLDVDFLELLVTSWKGSGGGQSPPAPRDELRVAPARLRARTCADSAAALARLLRHVAAPDGTTAGPAGGDEPPDGPTAGPAGGERPPDRTTEGPAGGERPPDGPTEGQTDRPADRPTDRHSDRPMGGQTGAPVGGPADGRTDRPTGGRTDGQTDRPTASPMARPPDRQTDRPTGGQTDGQTDRPTGGRTDGQTDRPRASPMARPPDRQTDRPTGGQTDRPTGGPTDRALDRRTDRRMDTPPADPPPAQWGSQAPPGPPTATINQQDLTDALRDPPRPPPGAPQPPGAAEAPPAPPVSVYLFPGEGGSRPHSGPTAAPPEPPPEPPPDPLGGSDSPDPDGFCILEAPPPPSPGSLCPPRVRWLQPGPLRVRDGHFGAPRGERDRLRPPPGLPPPRRRLLLRDAHLDWQLFGGRDFGPGHAPHRSRRGGPAPSGPAPSRWRIRGGPGRRPDLLMELHVGKVSVQHETYEEQEEGEGGAARGGPRGGLLAPGERPTARLVLLVPELELRDRLGGAAGPPFLCRHPRGGPPPQPPTLYIKALRVLPHPPPPGGVPECCLRVTLTPLRLHVDQDALIFLRDFASSFIEHLGPPTPPPRPPHAPPGPGDPPGLEPDEDPETEPLVYFREFRFTSEVPIWLDYRGKRVTMEQGALAGILIGLARLNCSRVRLKRLRHRQGLLGLRRVLRFALGSWLRDIRTHQLPGLLRGVAPLRAALRLGRALRELLLLPLVPLLGGPGGVPGGVTRGVSALGAASASAAIGLGTRLLRALQVLAEALYELVAPPSPPRLLAPPPETPADPPQSPPGARRSPAPPARDERPLPQ